MSTSTASPSASGPRADALGRRPVIIVAGPTASGKSALALAVAREFGGVVINADSMQVYRDLAILTARPGAGDMATVPHRLYGFRDAAEPYSAALWRQAALAEIAAAHADASVPVLCGGTGLYLSALMNGIAEIPAVPEAVRAAAIALHREVGGATLRARLGERDPATAARLADGDTQRLIRAWEVVEATGRPLSEWQAQALAPPAELRFHVVVLMPERASLYAACDGRFQRMIEAGALDEVASLMARRLDPDLPAMKALGVPQLAAHLDGTLDLDSAIEQARRETRRYAKRQCTWFRHQLIADQFEEAQFSERVGQKIFLKIRPFLLTESE